MSEFISILTIVTGLSFLILNFAFHFGELTYDFQETYSRFVTRHSKGVSNFSNRLDESLSKNPKLYRVIKDPERKYRVFFQVVYSFVALVLIIVGISSFNNATSGVIFTEIMCVVTVGIFSVHLLLIRRRKINEDIR